MIKKIKVRKLKLKINLRKKRPAAQSKLHPKKKLIVKKKLRAGRHAKSSRRGTRRKISKHHRINYAAYNIAFDEAYNEGFNIGFAQGYALEQEQPTV